MRQSLSLIIAACMISATPALAGNLTLNNGQTSWVSTQCQKPVAPEAVRSAKSDSSGDDMNGLVAQHNAWVDAMQGYMNCISSEAERDQVAVDQTITNNAQGQISAAQSEVDSSSPTARRR